jgi:hypothetical protein
LLPFQQDDIEATHVCEVIGDRATDYTATNDDNVSFLRQVWQG